MIIFASWLVSTDGSDIKFDSVVRAWEFLCRVDHSVTYLSDSRQSSWYPDNRYRGGFSWTWEGDSEEERIAFFELWHHYGGAL